MYIFINNNLSIILFINFNLLPFLDHLRDHEQLRGKPCRVFVREISILGRVSSVRGHDDQGPGPRPDIRGRPQGARRAGGQGAGVQQEDCQEPGSEDDAGYAGRERKGPWTNRSGMFFSIQQMFAYWF